MVGSSLEFSSPIIVNILYYVSSAVQRLRARTVWQRVSLACLNRTVLEFLPYAKTYYTDNHRKTGMYDTIFLYYK